VKERIIIALALFAGPDEKRRRVAAAYGSDGRGADTGTAAVAGADVGEVRDLTDTVRMPDSDRGALLAV
jgi:hypothetical protein